MGKKEDNIKKAKGLMDKLDFIRNIGIAAHIDHGKTTLSDNLLAGCGMMSEELAGKQLVLDYDEQEQDRGITINTASASMVHEFEGHEYLINLLDTPGHVDFGGDVTRAMRAVDGCIVVVCAVEGAMPQTETVIRQALRENVKPILFINKVDRLINELRVTPEAMQERFIKIISKFNELLNKTVSKEFKGKWNVKVEDGSVAFGSAFYNWAISAPYMKKSGLSFKDIYDFCNNNDQKTLAKKTPIHEVLLDMVVDHLPSPAVAQKYRIPHIWRGDITSELGKSMIGTDDNGPLSIMITKIVMDPHAGEVAVGRIYSGKVERGHEVNVIGMPRINRVQQVNLMVGADRIPVDFVSAGNIVAATGIRDAIAGSTVTDNPEAEPFEKIVHISEPVVTVAVEAKNTKDLPKLIEVLRVVSKADPSIQVDINQETGENLMSGMGELHLEITEYRIRNEHGVDIVTSEPIVVYRESVAKKSPNKFEGKSPNKHNRFYIEVEPLPENIVKALYNNEIPENVKKFKNEVIKKLQDLGMSKDIAKGVFAIKGLNLIADVTKGIQYLFETRELIKEAFDEVMKSGPTASEPCQGLLVRLVDAKLHEDAIHRGPAQVIPAVRNAIYGSITISDPILLEPMQKVFISTPQDLMGDASRELNQRRAVVRDMTTERDMVNIDAKAPVAEMFGFASAIRSATGGRVLWNTENLGFEPLPKQLQFDIVKQIRERKGLKPEPYPSSYYMD
jgi:elongation factor 2